MIQDLDLSKPECRAEAWEYVKVNADRFPLVGFDLTRALLEYAEKVSPPPAPTQGASAPAGIRLLTLDERASLKQLAEAATPGPWTAQITELRSRVRCAEGYSIIPDTTEPDARYIAAVSPDLTLGTLAYIEHLEARIANYQRREKRGGETWLVTKQFLTEQGNELNATKEALAAATTRAEAAEGRAAELARENANWRRGISPDTAKMLERIEQIRLERHAPKPPAPLSPSTGSGAAHN